MNADINGLGMFAISKLGEIPKYDIYCIIFYLKALQLEYS